MPYTGNQSSCKITRMHKESITNNAALVSYYPIELNSTIWFFRFLLLFFTSVNVWDAYLVSLYFEIDQVKYSCTRRNLIDLLRT